MSNFTFGTPCAVKAQSAEWLAHNQLRFIGAPCVVVKRTRAGLIQIALARRPRHTTSMSQRFLEFSNDRA